MKSILGHAPFIRIVVFIIIGIILQNMLQYSLNRLLFQFSVLVIINSFIVFYKNHRYLFKFNYFSSSILFLLLIVLGMLLVSSQQAFQQRNYFSNVCNTPVKYQKFIVLIDDDIHLTKNGCKTTAEITSVINDSNAYITNGKINLFFEDRATFNNINYGDKILIQATLNEIQEPMNPYEFNSKKYYALKNTHYQAYINTNQYNIISHHQVSVIKEFIYNTRTSLSYKFDKHIKDEAAKGVCKALLLGVEEDLDAQLLKAYASSGVIHVLSVSGLHVGIFYIIINFLFSLLKTNSKKIKWIKAVLSLLLIWFYALLSGFSPSVLRSAVMLTAVIIASSIDRKISIYNSLSVSCFILLCFQSNFIYDVGFQLSYLAVIGIISLQWIIYDLYVFKNYWLDKIWNMIGVSVSAQAITFPLSVYYFYQFPLLFLFANLIVIPIISLSLPIGFIFMFASIFQSDLLLHYIAIPLEWSIIISNKIILGFDKIPFNAIKPVFFTGFQTVFLYIILGSFLIAYILKNVRWYIVSLGLTLILFILFIIEKYKHLEQHYFMVYNIHNIQRIEFVDGNHVDVFSNQTDTTYYDSKIRLNHIHHQISDKNYYNTNNKNLSFCWHNKNILILNKAIKDIQLLNDYDYILVGNNAIDSIGLMNVLDENKQFVFDSSNSLKNIQKINCIKSKHIYSTKNEHVFIKEF